MTAEGWIDAARSLVDARTRRREVFGRVADGFGEPAWDMLLHLFVELQAGRPSIETVEACAAAASDIPTGTTYLRFLASHRMVLIDERAATVTLADDGARLMKRYLGANP